MNYLLDTHILLWAAAHDELMSEKADQIVKNPDNVLWFSAASIWEVAIKRSLDRPDFRIEPGALRAGLLSNGYQEIAIEGRHCLGLMTLPRLHADPFDRMLITQAAAEGMVFLTADRRIGEYPGPILLV